MGLDMYGSSSHHTQPLYTSSEKLLQQTEGEGKEQEKCREEVKELEDILPDLDSKVRIVEQEIMLIC